MARSPFTNEQDDLIDSYMPDWEQQLNSGKSRKDLKRWKEKTASSIIAKPLFAHLSSRFPRAEWFRVCHTSFCSTSAHSNASESSANSPTTAIMSGVARTLLLPTPLPPWFRHQSPYPPPPRLPLPLQLRTRTLYLRKRPQAVSFLRRHCGTTSRRRCAWRHPILVVVPPTTPSSRRCERRLTKRNGQSGEPRLSALRRIFLGSFNLHACHK